MSRMRYLTFSFIGCLTKATEPNLSNYLPIVGGRRNGFMPFLSILAQSEIQTSSARISTQITYSVSYDDIHNTNSSSESQLVTRLYED